MARLIFEAAAVRRVVEHTLAAPRQQPIAYTTDKVKEPAVILVHDQGVYLMSNGVPRDMLDAQNDEVGKGSFCAYARGCDPTKQEFDDWWERSRELVGGDDFAETLEWAARLKQMLDAGAKQITINVTANNLELMPVKKGKR
jgi:hypothetical protein